MPDKSVQKGVFPPILSASAEAHPKDPFVVAVAGENEMVITRFNNGESGDKKSE